MGSIQPDDPLSKILQSRPIENVSSGESDASKAEEMDYLLNWLKAFAMAEPLDSVLMKELYQVGDDFNNFMHQSPIPLQKMQDELNQLINGFNQEGWMGQLPNWDINANPPGKLLMQCMLTFSQFLAGVSGNSKMQDWVSQIGSFLNSGPWTAGALQSTLTQFTQDCAQSHIRIPPKNGSFVPPQVPQNLFT